jgi:TolA-binding protein
MKKILILLPVLLLAACTTVYSAIGIASTEYVDEQNALLQQKNEEALRELDQVDRQIQEILIEIAEIQRVSEELREAAGTIQETRAAMQELQQLAVGVEARMNALSGETLTQLRDLLSGYLEQQ